MPDATAGTEPRTTRTDMRPDEARVTPGAGTRPAVTRGWGPGRWLGGYEGELLGVAEMLFILIMVFVLWVQTPINTYHSINGYILFFVNCTTVNCFLGI